MVGPVVMRADEHQVVEFGGSAVLPVHDVMSVQTAGGSAAGYHAAAVAVFQDAA
jgi:hypothetical protein